MEKSAEELIAELADHRTRAAAQRELQRRRPAPTAQLLEAMTNDDNPTNMRWAAIALLGHFRYEPAVSALFALLKRDIDLRDAAARALSRITGHDFGQDVEAWEMVLARARGETAAAGEGVAPTSAPLEEESTAMRERLLATAREALGDTATEIAWEGDPGYVYLRLPLGGGRKQQLILSAEAAAAGGGALTLYTECGTVARAQASVVNARNASLACGSFELEAGDEETVRVAMRHRLPLEGLSARQLREAVLCMARSADELEHELTRSDRI